MPAALAHPLTMVRSVLGLTAVLLGALLLGWPSAAVAATDEPPPVRWSVVPADQEGPDGRTAVQLTLDPGESAVDRIAVHNVGAQEVTFRLLAADGFYTRTGRFDILAAGEQSVAAGTWISVPDQITVPAGETVVVPFDIAVPETAEPGDHAAGITASVLSVQSAEDGTNVGVETRVGVRVLLRVTGEIAPAAAIAAGGGSYTTSWNPLRPGEASVTFDVANDGNTRLLAEGVVEVGGQRVAFPREGESAQELLPGDTRTITVAVDDVWPLVYLPATVSFTPASMTMDGASEQIVGGSATVPVWALPWPQLIVLAGAMLVTWAIFWGRVRSRRRLAALLADAREQGRQAAASTTGVQ